MATQTDPSAPPGGVQGFVYTPKGDTSGQQFSGNPWSDTWALDAYVYKSNPIYGKREENYRPPGFVGPIDSHVVPGANTKYLLDTGSTGKTGTQYLSDLAKVDPHTVSQLQADLANLGLLQPDSYRVGDGTDERTLQAMAGVLRVAALKQISPDDAITYLKKYTPESQTLAGQKKAATQSLAQESQKAAYNTYLSDLQSTYLRTWGVPAPAGYVDRAAKAGMNIYEFEAHERSKPAFMNSEAGQTERLNLENQIAQWMGRG